MQSDDGPTADGQMNPTQRRIFEGLALTRVDTSFYDVEDAYSFKASAPFSYTKVAFDHERDNVSSISQFILKFSRIVISQYN